MRTHLDNEPHTVYRAYGTDDELLYVGCTAKNISRVAQHYAQDWWPRLLFMTFEHFPTRDEARLAEQRAIETERPTHNVVHRGWTDKEAIAVRDSASARARTRPDDEPAKAAS